MRAVGTGTHPEGRFPKGQVSDLPEALDGSGEVHPDYQTFLDNGWMELLDPKDDPGRTKTQIANSIVRGDALTHPVDAELADEIPIDEAYAVTHTGDPEASPKHADPHEVRGSRRGLRGVQLDPLPQGFRPGDGKASGEGTGNAGGTEREGDPVHAGGTGDRGTGAAERARTAGTQPPAEHEAQHPPAEGEQQPAGAQQGGAPQHTAAPPGTKPSGG